MSVSLLVLSGGIGERSRHTEPKQFYELAGHPVIAHSIIAAVQVERIREILINAPSGFEKRTEEIMKAYCGGRPFRILPSGATRQESARILVDEAAHDTVLLHEAARPIINRGVFSALLDHAQDNVGYTQEIPFSMCRVDQKTGRITESVARNDVFNVQLPQRFDRATLKAAHAAAAEAGKSYTEDAVMCVEMADAVVHSLPGSSSNLKITNWEDFIIAEHILNRLNK